MIITYLIGNGFDINLGLNTRYSDFIEAYKTPNALDKDDILKLKESIHKYCNRKENDDLTTINWSDTEIAFGQFTKEFIDVQDGDFAIANCHQDLCEGLASYLLSEENRLDVDAISEQDGFLETLWQSMLEFPKGLRQVDKSRIVRSTADISGGFDVRIICFNYTRILDSLVEAMNAEGVLGSRTHRNSNYKNTLGPVMHVHGTVEHGMVFGVNDESQLERSVFRDEEPELKRVMIKPQFNEDMGESVDTNVKNQLAASNIIYIYGMSIGETDKRWWEEIVRLMSINTTIILIVHSIDVPVIGLNPRDYTRYKRNFRNRFVGFGNNLDEKQKNDIANRIYVTNGNIFDCLSGKVSE